MDLGGKIMLCAMAAVGLVSLIFAVKMAITTTWKGEGDVGIPACAEARATRA